MLTAYENATKQLIQLVYTGIVPVATLDSYINTARGQVAAEGECIRIYGKLALASGTQQYPFSAITFPVGTEGVQGVLDIRMATYAVGANGQLRVTPREWEFFNNFVMNNPVPAPGPPKQWAQYGQGALGSIFVNLPDAAYTLSLDTVCYPVVLANDATPEAIPYLWTDAVPYFAAYMAFLQLGNKETADKFFSLYETFVDRARRGVTPSVLPHQYPGNPDPTAANKLGIQPPAPRGQQGGG